MNYLEHSCKRLRIKIHKIFFGTHATGATIDWLKQSSVETYMMMRELLHTEIADSHFFSNSFLRNNWKMMLACTMSYVVYNAAYAQTFSPDDCTYTDLFLNPLMGCLFSFTNLI